jgi:hypothetical protein
LLCGYCTKHKFTVTAAFLTKPAEFCKSCGVDTEKENKKAAAAQAAAAQRGAAWGVALPGDFAAASGLSASPTARGRRTSHAPTVQASWLPTWLLAAAASRGVSFNDPADPAKSTAAASAEVDETPLCPLSLYRGGYVGSCLPPLLALGAIIMLFASVWLLAFLMPLRIV